MSLGTAASGIRAQMSGAEETFGTEINATFALASVKISEGVKINSQKLKGSGAKLNTVIAYGSEIGDHSFEGMATYEEVSKFVKSLSKTAPATFDTFTLEIGDPTAAVPIGTTYPGTSVLNWVLKGNKDGVTVSGALQSKTFNSNAPTAALTIAPKTPIENKHVTISLAGTEVEDCFEWEMSVQNLWAMAEYVGANTPLKINEGDIGATVTLKVEATSTNRALMTDKAAKALIITMTNGAKSLTIKCNLQLSEPQKYEAQGQVYAFGLVYEIMNVEVGTTTNLIDVVSAG